LLNLFTTKCPYSGGGGWFGFGMRVRLENMKINCRLKPNPAAISKGWAMGFGGKTIALHLPYVSVCNFHFMFGRKNAGTAIKCTHTHGTLAISWTQDLLGWDRMAGAHGQ